MNRIMAIGPYISLLPRQ